MIIINNKVNLLIYPCVRYAPIHGYFIASDDIKRFLSEQSVRFFLFLRRKDNNFATFPRPRLLRIPEFVFEIALHSILFNIARPLILLQFIYIVRAYDKYKASQCENSQYTKSGRP